MMPRFGFPERSKPCRFTIVQGQYPCNGWRQRESDRHTPIRKRERARETRWHERNSDKRRQSERVRSRTFVRQSDKPRDNRVFVFSPFVVSAYIIFRSFQERVRERQLLRGTNPCITPPLRSGEGGESAPGTAARATENRGSSVR